MRFSYTIAEEDVTALATPEDPDSWQVGHLEFHHILERCGRAWGSFLAALQTLDQHIVPRLEVDFVREVHAGELHVDVSVLGTRGSSYTLRCDASQSECPVAAVNVVIVNYDYIAGRVLPLTTAQRSELNSYLAS